MSSGNTRPPQPAAPKLSLVPPTNPISSMIRLMQANCPCHRLREVAVASNRSLATFRNGQLFTRGWPGALKKEDQGHMDSPQPPRTLPLSTLPIDLRTFSQNCHQSFPRDNLKAISAAASPAQCPSWFRKMSGVLVMTLSVEAAPGSVSVITPASSVVSVASASPVT